jgi:dTDP-4-amino-4,6-dideoxygalactose transaminase
MAKLALFGGERTVPPAAPLAQMFVKYPFAQRFAEYVGAAHALPTANGTASIVSALLGAGVEPGDEVITVSHTWFCTATSILAVNAVPVFVDVDPKTFTMDPKKIEERISPRTRAILGVSLYGHPAEYVAILEIARRHGLVVIDDACQATGAAIGDEKLGSICDLTAFSFSGKPLSSTGGGMVTTSDRKMFERSMLGGQHPSYIAVEAKDPAVWQLASTGGYGHNLRLDGKCAERAYEQLEKLDATNQWRRKNALHLKKRLEGIVGIDVPFERPGVTHVYHFFTCLFDGSSYGITRDELVDALNAEGVPTMTYVSSVNFLKTPEGAPFYAGPLHRRFLFQELARTGRCGPYRFPEGVRPDYSAGSLPVTERLVDAELNIQQRYLSPPFDEATMDLYALAVKKVLENADAIREARKGGVSKREPTFLVAYESDA